MPSRSIRDSMQRRPQLLSQTKPLQQPTIKPTLGIAKPGQIQVGAAPQARNVSAVIGAQNQLPAQPRTPVGVQAAPVGQIPTTPQRPLSR